MVQREGFNVTDLFDLGGRVAVVTGGNGLGMARGLAQAGAAVMTGARLSHVIFPGPKRC
jgi:hypothetical protein